MKNFKKYYTKSLNSEGGQVVLILILVMTVALAIGISVIQRSLSDISTSTKVEQSSRAFSAAEAGIEQALTCIHPPCAQTTVNFSENQSSATVPANDLLPAIAAPGTRQSALEYPPLAREEVAQVWLADFNAPTPTNPPAAHYIQPTLDVFWGTSGASDKAALELTEVFYDTNTSAYGTQKWYLDPDSSRVAANKFTQVTCAPETITNGGTYACRYQITLPLGSKTSMLLRARLLYNDTSQPFAVWAVGTSGGKDVSLPPQTRRLISTGLAGTTQRKVQLFQVSKVVPPYFDYAIFSASTISK